jgi:hypothetical protein
LRTAADLQSEMTEWLLLKGNRKKCVHHYIQTGTATAVFGTERAQRLVFECRHCGRVVSLPDYCVEKDYLRIKIQADKRRKKKQ